MREKGGRDGRGAGCIAGAECVLGVLAGVSSVPVCPDRCRVSWSERMSVLLLCEQTGAEECGRDGTPSPHYVGEDQTPVCDTLVSPVPYHLVHSEPLLRLAKVSIFHPVFRVFLYSWGTSIMQQTLIG